MQIYPSNPKILHHWLTEQAKQIVGNFSDYEDEAEVFEYGDLKLITNLPGCPEEYVVIESSGAAQYSLLPPDLVQSLINGAGVEHMPVVTPVGVKILDNGGDNITSLYFPHRVLLKTTDVSYHVLQDPDLAVVNATVEKYDFRSPEKMFYELLVDTDELLLYRALSPYKTCFIEDDTIIFKAPAFPKVRMKCIEPSIFEVSLENNVSRSVRGLLSKVVLQLEPFPFFVFSFTEARCGDEYFDDLELPSFYLFDWSILNPKALYTIGSRWASKRLQDALAEKEA